MQEKITVFLIIILFITNLLRDYWGHYNFVTAISIPNNKEISSTGSVGRTPPLEKEKIILQDGTIETSDVESKDSFFG
jgi:hypothetical protein